MEYLDFELEIGPGLGREYPVAVIRSPAGEARETMCFPFDELALENPPQGPANCPVALRREPAPGAVPRKNRRSRTLARPYSGRWSAGRYAAVMT